MNKSIYLVLFLIAFTGCNTAVEVIDLAQVNWIHGAEDCAANTDPLIQVVRYNENTWILRQSKCSNYEAPFMFLFFGKEKALLMDTGATKEEQQFPLYKTILGIIDQWNAENNTSVELIVAHTHKHGDHYAADNQFKGKPRTTVVGLEVPNLIDFFGLKNWPKNEGLINLGDRELKIIPIPGHQSSSIAIYDTSTKLLLTGDTFYPGRLYVNDWPAFKKSIDRLVNFTERNEVAFILGNHIEMTSTLGEDYPIGTNYQPNEMSLPLTTEDLKALAAANLNIGDTARLDVHNRFIIYPTN
jgi:hydroxyacylglutathione hydrolase